MTNRPSLAALRRAMLPLDGSIHKLAPRILAAFATVTPRRRWGELVYADLTAGSCLLPMAFASAGVRRLIINDVAPRSTLAARALFGGRPIGAGWAGRAADRPATPPIPAFAYACDYLLKPVADLFDRLWGAARTDAQRYLALRFVQSFAVADDGDFPLLTTHDPARLRHRRGADWTRYLQQAATPLPVLERLTADIDRAIIAFAGVDCTVQQSDLIDLAPRLAWPDAPLLAAVNPPTRGLDEYTVDDQLIHSLLAGRWLPLSECPETARRFWTRRVNAGLAALPRGAFALVYGGDGSMSRADCQKVWRRHGVIRHAERDGPGLWAILERR